MVEIEINKFDYSIVENTPCVYRIWFNDHYYIGYSCSLEKRIDTHIYILKRLCKKYSVSPAIKKVYRKLIQYIETQQFIEVSVEVLFVRSSIQEVKELECILLNQNKHCKYSINNVKKK